MARELCGAGVRIASVAGKGQTDLHACADFATDARAGLLSMIATAIVRAT